jgi:hypothetical protein
MCTPFANSVMEEMSCSRSQRAWRKRRAWGGGGGRELAHREVDLHLVVGDVEPRAERLDVLGEERRLLVVEERDAHVAAGDHLGGQLPDHLAELHGEERAAEVPHHAAGARDHAAHLLRGVLLEDLGEGVGDAQRDGLGELRPHRHRELGPLGAGDEARGHRELADVGDLVEPERGDVERLVEGSGGGGGDLRLLGRGELAGALAGHLPVDAVARVAERALQLREQLADHLRILREARGAGQLLGVDLPVAAQESGEHPAELVLGIGRGLVGHGGSPGGYGGPIAVPRPVDPR